MLSIIPERDVCLFHEDDNDQSAYPCPSPLIDRGSDDLEDLMVLPCQVWFDAEAPEAFECDGLDTTATTEQHLRTLARSEVQADSPREISVNSKFLNTSVGTQKVEGEFAVRDVTKPTDATGQPTDEGREARPSEADGPVWSVKSTKRIMRLLRSKRSFSEMRDQRSEYVTHCYEQLCEQESGQARQMDRGEIEVEEERRVRAKRVPVLPTDKEKDEELMLKSETVNPEHVRGEMAKQNPSEATETSLDSTNSDGERLPQRRTTRKQWQRNAFTNFTGVPRNPKELAKELMTRNRRKCISKFSIQRYGETPSSSECLGTLSRRTTTCRERFERLINPSATDVTSVIPSVVEDPSPAGDTASTKQRHATQPDTSKHVHQAFGMKRGAEVNQMFSSAKRAHAIHPPVPQILSQLRVEKKMMPVPEDAMEARTDVEMGTE